MADAAGSAGDQRRDQWRHVRLEKESPHPLRAQKALVTGKGQRVNMHGRHIDGQHARRLGGIQYEFQAVGMAESPNFRRRQHRAADVAGMQHHNSPRVIPQQSRHGRRIQRTVPSARDTDQRTCPGFAVGSAAA